MPLEWPTDRWAALAALATEHELVCLQSDAPTPRNPNPLTVIAYDPVGVLEQPLGAEARLIVSDRTLDRDASFWRLWRRTLERLARAPQHCAGYGPGLIGYVGYAAAAQLERLPAARPGEILPIARLALFDRVILLHERERRAELLCDPAIRKHLGMPPRATERTAEEWCRAIWSPRALPPHFTDAGPAIADLPAAGPFAAAVRRALDYIAAGDIYQVNLAHRITLGGLPSPVDCFERICRTNPAPFAALLSWREADQPCGVVSASPELMLRVRGSNALTSPIKGTRPRSGDPALDRARISDLLASDKDAAELAMIVDLHRNDLGRVCAPGSIRVVEPRRLEAHPRVFHTVADIVGGLAPGRDALDLLAASFPAGSVTGAPKLRAMQIIHELEPAPRGVFTGAIGALSLDGSLTLNVAIRTLQLRGEAGHLHVGGGIVADSDPAAEYAETLAKARGVLEALGLAGQPTSLSRPPASDRA